MRRLEKCGDGDHGGHDTEKLEAAQTGSTGQASDEHGQGAGTLLGWTGIDRKK